MKILVDADACPVKESIVRIAKQHNLDVWMYFDTSHVYDDGYSKVFIIDKGRDTVDIALINQCSKGDIVITQDYGVASMALAKQAKACSQNGLEYTNFNIDSLLESRHANQLLRKQRKRVKGPKKRTKEMDIQFEKTFKKIVKESI